MNYLEIVKQIPANVSLIVVSKTASVEAIRQVYDLGCLDFGENRVQDALAKRDVLPKDIRWHFIGTLQKNKVKKVVGHFALIHSVDSVELAEEISKHKVPTDILLQVNTSGEASKQGFTPDDLVKNLSSIQQLPYITVKGLMTMAPLTEDKEVIRKCFRDLRILRDRFGLQELSMGMSHDYQIAIEEGATMVRIGTAIFS